MEIGWHLLESFCYLKVNMIMYYVKQLLAVSDTTICPVNWNTSIRTSSRRPRCLHVLLLLSLQFLLPSQILPTSLQGQLITFLYGPVQFSSVAQSCPTLCDPMNCSTPGLPVHHQLQEFTQTHIHWVSDAIQPSHPLSSPSPLAPNPAQHQSLFQWVNSSHEVAKVLEFQL